MKVRDHILAARGVELRYDGASYPVLAGLTSPCGSAR